MFCIGVGNEVNRPLLEQMADESGGLAAFLSAGDDFDRQAQAFRRKLTRPAMSQLEAAVRRRRGVRRRAAAAARPVPRLAGADLRPLPRRGAADRCTLNAEVLGKPVEADGRRRTAEVDDANPEIERMWAWHRVDRLMDEDRRSGSTGAHA